MGIRKAVSLLLTAAVALTATVVSPVSALAADDDTVTLSFEFSRDTDGRSTLYVNGGLIEYTTPTKDSGVTACAVTFPKSLLVDGENIISFVPWCVGTGNFDPSVKPSARNYNDTTVKNLSLEGVAPSGLTKRFPADADTPMAQKSTESEEVYAADTAYKFGDGAGNANTDITIPCVIDFAFDLGSGASEDAFTLYKSDADTPPQALNIAGSSSAWRYLDDNSDPFTATSLYAVGQQMGYGDAVNAYRYAWTLPHSPYSDAGLNALAGATVDIGVDDSAWQTADGPFGYKNSTIPSAWGTLGTVLAGNIPGTSNRVKTYFFRHNFDLEDASWVKSASYELRFDDAVIIYLNGTEIGRHNVKTGGYASNLEYNEGEGASAPGNYIETEAEVSVPAGLLIDGSNTLAVELHQDRASSSDIYLNFTDFTLSPDLLDTGAQSEITGLTFQPGADESELNFTWLSNANEPGTLSVWRVGETPATFSATAAQLSQSAGYLTNKAVVTGLAPGVTYSYKASNGDTESDVYTFKTGGNTSERFSFLLAGDPQIGSSGNVGNDTAGWQGTISRALSAWTDIDFIISAGDQVETANTEAHYAGYLSPAGLKNIPVATTIGNHDNSANYQGHFNLPNHDTAKGATSAGGDYRYTYGDALFLHINSNNLSTAEHKAFIENSVASYKNANGGEEPVWKIVVFHHSIYSSASHTTDSDIRQRRSDWSPVFSELGIDAVLAGHDHVYTRSLMMNGTTPITDGYTAEGDDPYAAYTQSADGGEVLYITANSASGSKYYALKQTDFPFVAKQNQENTPNITKIDVTPDSLTFTTCRTGANNTVNDTVDVFTLNKYAAQNSGEDPVETEAGGVTVGLKGPSAVKAGKDVVYEVSVADTTNLGNLLFKIETTGGLTLKSVAGQNGANLYSGETESDVTVGFLESGLTASGEATVLKLTFTAGAAGSASVRLTDVKAAGLVIEDGKPVVSGWYTVSGPSVKSLTVKEDLAFDINGDDKEDPLDLTLAQYYYQLTSASPQWDARAAKADQNSDGKIDLGDLIEIYIAVKN